MPLDLEQIIRRGQISLINGGELNSIRREPEPYPEWTATS